MTYPHVTQFEASAVRRQPGLELAATRGRSMWREPRPAKQPRRRFRLRAAL